MNLFIEWGRINEFFIVHIHPIYRSFKPNNSYILRGNFHTKIIAPLLVRALICVWGSLLLLFLYNFHKVCMRYYSSNALVYMQHDDYRHLHTYNVGMLKCYNSFLKSFRTFSVSASIFLFLYQWDKPRNLLAIWNWWCMYTFGFCSNIQGK